MTYLEALEEEHRELMREYYKGNRNFYFDQELHLLNRLIRKEKWKNRS